MTHQQLSQYRDLNEELKDLEDKLQVLQTQATKITPTLSLASGGAGNNTAKFENNVDKRIELEDKILELHKRINDERLEVQNFINCIEDSFTRRIISLRFVDCCFWKDVAKEMGGKNTADSVRMTYKRFMKNC